MTTTDAPAAIAPDPEPRHERQRMFSPVSVVIILLLLGVVMFAIYVPLGYATDSAIYRFRNKRKQAQAVDRQARKRQ